MKNGNNSPLIRTMKTKKKIIKTKEVFNFDVSYPYDRFFDLEQGDPIRLKDLGWIVTVILLLPLIYVSELIENISNIIIFKK